MRVDYTKLSKTYDNYRLPQPTIEWILSKLVGNRHSSLILDVGCGTGRYTIPLASRFHVIGLDASRAMLEEALKKDKWIEWVCGDGEMLPFKSNTFDHILMILVYHHFENKRSALKEAHRTLKLKGKLSIQTFSHTELRRRFEHYFCGAFPTMYRLDLERFSTISALKNNLADIGFRNVNVQVVVTEHTITVSKFLEYVKNKFISTLTLIPDEEFEKGLEHLKKKLIKKFGTKILDLSKFTVITCEKIL